MIKAILFDLDNTLIDFMRFKHQCCNAAIDAMIGAGLKVNHTRAYKTLFDLYDKYGMEDPLIFQKLLKRLTKKVDYKILAAGIVAYRRVRAGFLEPYPNVDYVLMRLKSSSVKLAIVTDAPKLKAWIRLTTMKLTNYFDVVVAFEDTKKHKPNKEPFEAALKKLRLKAGDCLMIGDWPERDIKGAKALGMKTCFARYGNQKIKKSNADYEINDIRELLDIVAI